MTIIDRVWKGKGKRAIVKSQMKFENGYLYKAVEPKTGESFSLILPRVNTECMNKYLEEFKKYVGDKEVVIIMDNARYHKTKGLKIPEGIEIEFIPPYSPELNPVERVFQEIKKKMKNEIYKNMDELMDKLSDSNSKTILDIRKNKKKLLIRLIPILKQNCTYH